jgi:hypothetical protein
MIVAPPHPNKTPHMISISLPLHSPFPPLTAIIDTLSSIQPINSETLYL